MTEKEYSLGAVMRYLDKEYGTVLDETQEGALKQMLDACQSQIDEIDEDRPYKEWSDDALDEEIFEVKVKIVDLFQNGSTDEDVRTYYTRLVMEQAERQEEGDVDKFKGKCLVCNKLFTVEKEFKEHDCIE